MMGELPKYICYRVTVENVTIEGQKMILKEVSPEEVAEDLRPVVRGKWIKYEDTSLVYCNVCNHMNGSTMFMENRRDFCPNCGADMRGWADE